LITQYFGKRNADSQQEDTYVALNAGVVIGIQSEAVQEPGCKFRKLGKRDNTREREALQPLQDRSHRLTSPSLGKRYAVDLIDDVGAMKKIGSREDQYGLTSSLVDFRSSRKRVVEWRGSFNESGWEDGGKRMRVEESAEGWFEEEGIRVEQMESAAHVGERCEVGDIYRVPGDGNCFFHVLARFLRESGLGYTAGQLREQVVDFLSRWRQFIDQIDPDPHRAWEVHLSNMRRDGTWATRLEVIASAEMFGLMVYTWERSESSSQIIDIVRPIVPTTHGIQMLHMMMCNRNHYNSLDLIQAVKAEKEAEVQEYNDELQHIRAHRVVDNEGFEVIGINEMDEWETGISLDRIVKIEANSREVRDMVQVSQSVGMLWEQLKESGTGFALYYDNKDDDPENVLGDGYCGYRTFDAVSQGLQEHKHRLEVAVVRQMRAHSRQDSAVNVRCGEVITALQQGQASLTEIFWLNRRDFADLICPVPVFLWMVAYEENFNVLVGAGEAGRYMRTGESRILITRKRVMMYLREQGRDIVYSNFHFFLGSGKITIQRIDEALFQLAQRLWCRRLEQVGELVELSQEINRSRSELYYVYYPP
jgi:hypothetical protein